MHLGENLQAYSQLIKDNVFYYAYENHLPTPVLNESIPEWLGEVFDTANIDTELHLDLIEDLKTLGLYEKITRDTDKFVILPDVFSSYPIPLRKYTDLEIGRNQYDTDRKNIVIINGKLFELHRELAEAEYYYNHNGKFYYFYKNNPDMEVLFNPANKGNNTISCITIRTSGHLTDRVNYTSWNRISDPENGFALYIDKNNHWIRDNIALRDRKEAASIYINLPYVSLDYTKLNSEPEVDIPGVVAIGWRDMDMRPKWYNNDHNQFFIQNPDLIFTTTALVLLKNGEYKVENLYNNSKGKYVERIDKHTVKFAKSNKIREIIMFALPYKKPSFERPDSLYYKAILKNPMVSEFIKDKKCNTTKLYEWMIRRPCLEVEDLIDYGYKHDVDVLKVIQNTFPRVINISKYDVSIHQYYGHTDSKHNSFKYVYNKIWFRDIENLAKTSIFSNSDLWTEFMTRLQTYSFNEVIYNINNIFEYAKFLLRRSRKIDFNPSLSRFRYLLEQLIKLMQSYMDRMDIYRDFPEYPAVVDFFISLLYKEDEYFYVMEKQKKTAGEVIPIHTFHYPKILIPVFNPLNKYPALFINNILYPIDYKIIKDHDVDVLVIDPKNFYEFYVSSDISDFTVVNDPDKNNKINNYIERETSYYPSDANITNDRDIDYLYAMWIKSVKGIKIVLADYTEMKDPSNNKHIHGRMARDPFNDYAFIDEFSSSKENNTLYKGEPFVNGLLSNDSYSKKDVEIPLNLSTPVYAYGYGPNNMDNKLLINENEDIFRNLDTSFAVTNVEFKYPDNKPKKFFGSCRINLGEKYNIFADYTVQDHSGYKLQAIPKALSRDNQIICFNQYGLEVNDLADILSTKYIDLNDIRYEYDTNRLELQTENQCVSVFIPSYKSVQFDYDLNIDSTRVAANNTHYNDRVMELNEVVELFDPVPNKAKSWRPYDINDIDTIYKKTLAIRYGYNERSIASRDISSITETDGIDIAPYLRSDAFRGYNPLDFVFSGLRLKEMLETAKMTFIIDHTTPQLFDHNAVPPMTLNDWRIAGKSAMYIDCNTRYHYDDDPDDVKNEVKKFRKVPENTLVLKYNTDILRRFK